MALTGMRPFEVTAPQRGHIKLHQHRIGRQTKGGKTERTPLSRSMSTLFAEYQSSRSDDSMAAFVA